MSNEESKKKKVRIVVKIVGILIWLLLTRLCAYSALHGDTMRIATGETVLISFFIAPFLIIGALYGYLYALISFTITFIIKLIFNMNSAYFLSIDLVATMSFSLVGQYFFFSSKKKTALGALITLILTAVIELACFSIIAASDYRLDRLIDYGGYFLQNSIVIFALAFLFHFLYTKAPDIIKLPFPIGISYTKRFQENKDIQRSLRKTKVSVKITAIIIAVEVILGICVAIFMVALFPDIKKMFVSSINQGEILSDISTQLPNDEIAEQVEGMRYRLDSSAISYDIKMMLLMLCVGVPMAGFANFYTKMTIGGPLGNMSDFMQEYAEADDEKKLEVGRKADKMTVRTNDEIQVVYDSVKETVHAIEAYIGRINEENELQKELEVARRSSEAKSSFLSNMSHEIRTPINAVLGLDEMIIRESSEEKIVEYASSIKSAGASLLGIVNDILDFSKIEAGKMDILPVTYHLGSVINDLINMVEVKASEKGLELIMNIDKTLPTNLIGDEIRIKQCVTNILSNAVKYTERGSVTLNISYRKADDLNIFLKFQVIDTGIGIKEEDISKLYSPFERIEEIRNRSIEGTGLGMSIVKKLLALMDSKLVVKSEYGKGSDFSFEVKQQVASWEELGDFKENYKAFLKNQNNYHVSFTAPDATILVVDDTAVNLTVVKGLLKNTLINVDTAESGRQTLKMVTQKKYDIIFIDHRMPEMDGLETLQAMKELDGNLCVGTPCIALTANAGAGARDEYIAAGFNDYLSKPVDGLLLEAMIQKFLPEDKVKEANENQEVPKNDHSDDDLLSRLQGIDISEGIRNCGTEDLLKEVIKEFLISITSKADDIERFEVEGNIRNFTVAVHALKSSARLIGATQLSGMAAHLEACGNDENIAEIRNKTPELLSLYRSYNEKLAAIDEKNENEDLPPIDANELRQAFSDMRELIEAYDYDTADGIMQELSGYSIPDEFKDKYAKVRQLIAAVDRDALLDVLEV
jgi:signal transduction histidine kinase/DNA-binding NarL/FixJ family response regulator